MAADEQRPQIVLSRGRLRLTLGSRTASALGEALLGGTPDFVVFSNSLRWDHGPTGPDEAARLRRLIEEAAEARGWAIEFE